jgi:hypothetical protein
MLCVDFRINYILCHFIYFIIMMLSHQVGSFGLRIYVIQLCFKHHPSHHLPVG